MDINNLKLEALTENNVKVDVWVKCHSVKDIDYLIEWLTYAKEMLTKLETKEGE